VPLAQQQPLTINMKHHRVRETPHRAYLVAEADGVADDEERVAVAGVEVRAGVEVGERGRDGADGHVVG